MQQALSPEFISIRELLGGRALPDADTITQEEVKQLLPDVLADLSAQGVVLNVLGDYDERAIYEFVASEFLREEIEKPSGARRTLHFCYEDYHPDHAAEIGQRCMEFAGHWFAKKMDDFSWELGELFVHPDSRTFAKAAVVRKMNSLFDCCDVFSGCEFAVEQLTYEWDERRESGKAHCVGTAGYHTRDPAGRTLQLSGACEFYLESANGWWTIYYFVFPGFSWNDQWPD